MRQEKAAIQYKPSAARDANGNWYKVKDHEVREAGIGDFEQCSAKPTNPSQPLDEGARREGPTLHGARYASDSTRSKRHRSASSTNGVEL